MPPIVTAKKNAHHVLSESASWCSVSPHRVHKQQQHRPPFRAAAPVKEPFYLPVCVCAFIASTLQGHSTAADTLDRSYRTRLAHSLRSRDGLRTNERPNEPVITTPRGATDPHKSKERTDGPLMWLARLAAEPRTGSLGSVAAMRACDGSKRKAPAPALAPALAATATHISESETPFRLA